LALADREFFVFPLWQAYLKRCTQLVWRGKTNFVLEPLDVLHDDSPLGFSTAASHSRTQPPHVDPKLQPNKRRVLPPAAQVYRQLAHLRDLQSRPLVLVDANHRELVQARPHLQVAVTVDATKSTSFHAKNDDRRKKL
jgi:hypothetical protein